MQGRRSTWLWTAFLLVALALAPAAATATRKPRPNLHELSLKAPSGTRVPGALLTVRDRVVNRGRATAGRSTVGFYLSSDVKLGGKRKRIGARAVKPLRRGRTSTAVKTLRLPKATAPGTYRLVACADYLRRVRESSERDNCVTAPGMLTVKSPPVEPQPQPGPGEPLPSPANPNDPTPVTLTSPADGFATNAADVGFSGDAAPGSLVTVSVREAGAEVGSLQALPGDDGHWSASATGLPEGSYTASAQQTDSLGRTQASTSRAFRVDRTAPLPLLQQPANGSTTADTSPTADGTRGSAEGDLASVTVKLYDSTGAEILSVPVASPGDAWSSEIETDLGEGTYKAAVEQRDSAGNVGRSAESTFQVDDTGPLVTLVNPASDARIGDTTPTINGTAEGSAAVTVNVYPGPSATGTPTRTLTATGPNWSVTPTTALSAGQYTAQASQLDAVGNVGTSAPHTFTIDTTSPTVTIDHPTGSTNDTTPTFDGTASTAAGDLTAITVDVTPNGGGTVTHLAATVSGGTWSVTPSSALAAGAYTAVVHQSDSAGNSASSSRTFTIDTSPPSVTVGVPTAGSTPTFSGSAEAGAVTVKVFAGSSASGTPVSVLSATGPSWSVAQATALSDGQYTVIAQQTDAAGNTGTSSPRTFTIDTLGPRVTLDQPADGAITNDTTPTFSGTAEDTTTVTVRVSVGGSVTTTLTAMPSGGNWSVAPGTALPQGSYTVQAEQRDASNNLGQSTVHDFEIDTTKPTLTLTVNSSNTSVHVVADDSNFQSLSCTKDGGAAAVSPTPSSTHGAEGDVNVTGDGSHTVACTATDKATNAQTASKTFTLDSTPPVVGITSPAAGATLDDPTPTFSGTAGTASGDASTVTVKVFSSPGGALLRTLVAPVSGSTWAATDSTNLPEGSYTVRAEQSDAGQNTGVSATRAFTIGPATMLTAGDIGGCEDGNDAAGTAALLRARPQGIVQTLGDNVYGNAQYKDGTLADFQNCYGPNWGSEFKRTKPAIGNHEYNDPNAAGYFAYFGAAAGNAAEGWYSYDLGAWHVVVLNSNCTKVGGCNAGAEQDKWLKADLAAHPAQCTAAVWHHPLFTSDAFTGQATTVKPLYQDLYDAHADLNLVGHAHEYERFAAQNPSGGADPQNGIVEIVAGMGGESHSSFASSFRPNSLARNATDYGILQLTLHQSSWSWQFVPVAGAAYTDSGSASCH